MNVLPFELHRHTHSEPWTYAQLDQRQREIQARVLAGGSGAVLLSEVAPVVTLGRRTPAEHLHFSPAEFHAHGIERFETDRGGLATYHGPGQWILFMVERVDRLASSRTDVRGCVRLLLEVVHDAVSALGIDSRIQDREPVGLWVGERKLAALGISIRQGVLLHGVALGVYRTPESFLGINPCGLSQQPVFIEELLHPQDRSELMNRVGDLLRELTLKRISR